LGSGWRSPIGERENTGISLKRGTKRKRGRGLLHRKPQISAAGGGTGTERGQSKEKITPYCSGHVSGVSI